MFAFEPHCMVRNCTDEARNFGHGETVVTPINVGVYLALVVPGQNPTTLYSAHMATDFQFQTNTITFFGEQKGEVEDKIKTTWTKTLGDMSEIGEAYLAIVDFGEGKPHPVLCLYPSPRDPGGAVARLSADFKTIFGTDQYVDIVFLDDKLRAGCKAVCPPFYSTQ